MPVMLWASPQVGFFFRVEPPTVLYIICLVSVLVSTFYFQVHCWMPYSPLGAQPLGFVPLQPLGVYPWQAYMQPGDGHWPTPSMHRVAVPSTTLSGGESSATQSPVPQPSHLHGGAYSFGGWQRVTQSLCLPYMVGRGSTFPGFVPSDDTVNSESVMAIKPGDSGVVIGYQVEEFTCTPGLGEWFGAHYHIYPRSLVRYHH